MHLHFPGGGITGPQPVSCNVSTTDPHVYVKVTPSFPIDACVSKDTLTGATVSIKNNLSASFQVTMRSIGVSNLQPAGVAFLPGMASQQWTGDFNSDGSLEVHADFTRESFGRDAIQWIKGVRKTSDPRAVVDNLDYCTDLSHAGQCAQIIHDVGSILRSMNKFQQAFTDVQNGNFPQAGTDLWNSFQDEQEHGQWEKIAQMLGVDDWWANANQVVNVGSILGDVVLLMFGPGDPNNPLSFKGWNRNNVVVFAGNGSGSSSPTATRPSGTFADAAFQSQWQQGEGVTPNFWGLRVSDGKQEPYVGAPGGQRTVQYFDKGRMELNGGTVTNGLLATELVTGRVQTGDATFESRSRPNIPIAGDPDSPGPTYASLSPDVLAAAPSKMGGTVANAQIAGYDAATQHNVPNVFASYRNQAGLLTIGLAISEPFTATVKVAGQQRQVMIQVFERRVLTYTASNPDAFKVEMGNIGQHYYHWRYA